MKLEEILMQENVVDSINCNIKELLELIPELRHMIRYKDYKYNGLNAWQFTLYLLSITDMNLEHRVSILLHDIGIPFSKNNKEYNFKSNVISEVMAKRILSRLKYNKTFIDKVCNLIVEENYKFDNSMNKDVKKLLKNKKIV